MCKRREPLDLADLGATLLLIETLERVLEEVRVCSKTRVFRDAVIILASVRDEKVNTDNDRT